jgi:hypothetical protein
MGWGWGWETYGQDARQRGSKQHCPQQAATPSKQAQHPYLGQLQHQHLGLLLVIQHHPQQPNDVVVTTCGGQQRAQVRHHAPHRRSDGVGGGAPWCNHHTCGAVRVVDLTPVAHYNGCGHAFHSAQHLGGCTAVELYGRKHRQQRVALCLHGCASTDMQHTLQATGHKPHATNHTHTRLTHAHHMHTRPHDHTTTRPHQPHDYTTTTTRPRPHDHTPQADTPNAHCTHATQTN